MPFDTSPRDPQTKVQGPFFLLPNHNSTLDRKKKKFLSITLKTPYTAEELGLK